MENVKLRVVNLKNNRFKYSFNFILKLRTFLTSNHIKVESSSFTPQKIQVSIFMVSVFAKAEASEHIYYLKSNTLQ